MLFVDILDEHLYLHFIVNLKCSWLIVVFTDFSCIFYDRAVVIDCIQYMCGLTTPCLCKLPRNIFFSIIVICSLLILVIIIVIIIVIFLFFNSNNNNDDGHLKQKQTSGVSQSLRICTSSLPIYAETFLGRLLRVDLIT